MSACDRGSQGTQGSGFHTTELSQWIGKNVRVELRRDALGGSASLPINPPSGGETNAGGTAVVGRLLKLHSISMVVEDGQGQKWIPREVILYVELLP
jgi:hypothetical protein